MLRRTFVMNAMALTALAPSIGRLPTGDGKSAPASTVDEPTDELEEADPEGCFVGCMLWGDGRIHLSWLMDHRLKERHVFERSDTAALAEYVDVLGVSPVRFIDWHAPRDASDEVVIHEVTPWADGARPSRDEIEVALQERLSLLTDFPQSA